MRLRRLRSDAVPVDWAAYLAAVQEVVAAGRVELDDARLLLAVVHVARLERAANDQAVARALPGVPFRDAVTAWDAGLLPELPALAHLEGVRLGAPALARLVADPAALAGLAAGSTEEEVLYAALAVGEAQAEVVEQARKRLRARPTVDEHLHDSGYGQGLERRWDGLPARYDDQRPTWDRLALVLFVTPALGEDDFDDQLARLPQSLRRTAEEPYVGDAELWLGELEEGWFELVLDLELELQGAGGQRGPWTAQPWDAVTLLLVVRDGPPCSRLEAARQLQVDVPLDPAGLLPLEPALDRLMRDTAAALLAEVPDLTGPARALLESRASAAD